MLAWPSWSLINIIIRGGDAPRANVTINPSCKHYILHFNGGYTFIPSCCYNSKHGAFPQKPHLWYALRRWNECDKWKSKIASRTGAHSGFTLLHHQQLDHKASTGNGPWSIAFQQVSPDALQFYLEQPHNLRRMFYCFSAHHITVINPQQRPIRPIYTDLFSSFKLSLKGFLTYSGLTIFTVYLVS